MEVVIGVMLVACEAGRADVRVFLKLVTCYGLTAYRCEQLHSFISTLQ
jgi:hypothetical protein